jgi:hypothetical protein
VQDAPTLFAIHVQDGLSIIFLFRCPWDELAGDPCLCVTEPTRVHDTSSVHSAHRCRSLEDKGSIIAFPELAPDSGAATWVERNQRSPLAGCCMTDPWSSRLPMTTATPASSTRRPPLRREREIFVKSAGCGVFPHRAGIRFSVARDGIAAIEQAGHIRLARRLR